MITITKPFSEGDSTEYVLSDAMSAVVEETLNNSFEMTMTYPVSGKNFNIIQKKAWIRCNSNPYVYGQLFMIYFVSKPISGIVTVRAQHKFYVAANAVCRGRTSRSKGNKASEITGYMSYEAFSNPEFGAASFYTDIPDTIEADFNYEKPASCRQIMSDAARLFGGMWEFNNETAILKYRRGTDRGFTVQYGVNAIDTTTEHDITAKYTHICPFWIGDVVIYSGSTEIMEKQNVFTENKYIEISPNPDFFNPYMYDCTDLFISKPTEQELISAAESFAVDPSNRELLTGKELSVTVNFVALKKTSEYINDENYSAENDRVEIGDNVKVITRYNETENMICTGTRYDVIKDIYISIELGYMPEQESAKKSYTSTVTTKKAISYSLAVNQQQTSNINYTLAHPAAPIPNKIVKVSDNEVYAVYGNNRRETWKADGTGNERHNFRKIITAEV